MRRTLEGPVADLSFRRQDADAMGENVRYLKRSMLGEIKVALEEESKVEVDSVQD